MPPTGKCLQVGMFENVHSTREKREILLSRNKEWRQPNIGETSKDARIITLSGELCYRLHTTKGISVNLQEQDKSSDIEQQPPFKN